MATAPPPKTRPTWKTETMDEPKAYESGSTSVACCPIGFVVVSTESWRLTTSQSPATTSFRSASTMSRPAPQRTRSTAPSAWAATRSSPLPPSTVSRPAPPWRKSPPARPRSVSLPARPSIESGFAVPVRRSARGVPTMLAAPATPVMTAPRTNPAATKRTPETVAATTVARNARGQSLRLSPGGFGR